MAQQQAADRPLRNVFVGNIPYDATEEKLREIFTTVGPVLSFRLVYDRETGKPKGYGFCEYKDQETAASAIRNLNGYDIGGRQLRVDSASDVRGREEELRNSIPNVGQPTSNTSGGSNMMGSSSNPGPTFHETAHTNEVEPDKAPENINKIVASLPPEQMFELAKQMKQTIQNNPNEARAMLVQNPQLVYALLQTLVVVRAIDPQTAMNILHKQMAQQIPVATFIQAGTIMAPAQPTQIVPGVTNVISGIPMQQPIGAQQTSMVQGMPMQVSVQQGMPGQHMMVPNLGPAFSTAQQYNTQTIPMATNIQPVVSNPGMMVMNPTQTAVPSTTIQSNDPRLARGRGALTTNQPLQQQQQQQQQQQPQAFQQNIHMSDQQKAELLKQVLEMSNEQIAQLPHDQQQKVFMLREQVRAQGGPSMA